MSNSSSSGSTGLGVREPGKREVAGDMAELTGDGAHCMAAVHSTVPSLKEWYIWWLTSGLWWGVAG